MAIVSLVLASAAALHACAAPDIEGDDLLPVGVPQRVASDPKVDGGDAEPSPNEADAATDAPVLVDATDAADASRDLKAFVSSMTFTGNLGGLAGADAKCQNLAAAKGLAGTYRAWLSVAGTNAADRITSNGPWSLVTGELVASTKAELVSGTLRHALNKDENGVVAPLAEDRVWTATTAAGAHTTPDCTGWTGAGSGLVGEAELKSSAWTSQVNEACSEVNRVYCFEL